MAAAEEYAQWIVANADKKGTPAFQTVSEAYKAAKSAGEPAPSIPTQPKAESDYLREELKKGDWLTRNLAGVGGAMMSGAEGLKGLVGKSDPATVQAAKVTQEEAPVGSIVGNVAMFAPTMMIPGVNTVPGAAIAGGVYNALTTPGNLAERKNAAFLGTVGGGAAQGVSNALSSAFPNASKAGQTLLEREGITLTPGQHAGGMWKNLEDKATSIPILGDVINTARKRGIGEFNEAAIKRATLPGMQVDGVGRGALQDLRQGLGDSYKDIAAKANIPAPDQQFLQNMVNLGQMSQSLPAQEAKEFVATVQRELIERMGPNGQLNGQAINEAIAGLKNRAKHFKQSNGAWERDLGAALDEASKEVFNLMERANPALAQELATTNKAYAHFKTLQKAASGVGAEEGIFTPAQLQRAVKSSDKTKDNRAFSEGTALYQDLTDAGKAVMPSKVPDSGTAGRLASNFFSLKGLAGLAGGGVSAIPAMAAYSKTGSKAMNALYDKLAGSGNPNALRLIMQEELSRQGN